MKYFIINLTLALLCRGAISETCTTPLGRTSQCISLNKCPDLLAAFSQRPLSGDVVDFLRKSQCGFENLDPKVCCGPIAQPSNSNTSPNPSQVGVDRVNSTDSNLPSVGQCGFDNGNRIYGGNVTDIDEFPWMALLGYKSPTDNKMSYQCGGSLINARYILTAGHCVVGEIETLYGKLTTARLGEYDTRSAIDCVKKVCADPVQEISVQSTYVYPEFAYQKRVPTEDIAVLRLAKRAIFTSYIQPICLVDVRERVNLGDSVSVAGWGKTLQGSKSDVKLKLEISIFSKSECVTLYRGVKTDVTTKQICAGGVLAQDTCRGDSGGPLMRLASSGFWEAIGVVSFGNGCGMDGWPGVYTSVASYIDWIKTTVRNSNV